MVTQLPQLPEQPQLPKQPELPELPELSEQPVRAPVSFKSFLIIVLHLARNIKFCHL